MNTLRFAETGMVVALAIGATACSASEQAQLSPSEASQEATLATRTPGMPVDTSMSRLVPGCKIFNVYSQDKFTRYGTAVRTAPDVDAPKSNELAYVPNEVIPIDGWEYTDKVYPNEPPGPLRSKVWFHVAPEGMSKGRDEGVLKTWVSFPGVRAKITHPDAQGDYSNDLGPLVPLNPACEIKPPIDVPR